MGLEIFTTGAEDYGTHIKALFCGDAGAGKTLISSTFPNPFYASAEGGLMSVARRRMRGTEIRTSEQLRELRGYLDQEPDVRAQTLKGPVDTIVIDTIDEIQKILIQERLAAKRLESLDQQSWGWLGDKMRAILKAYRNLPMNVVFTCHLKESADQTTGQIFVKPALQGAVGDEVSQYMDLALLLKTELATRIVGQTTERYERRFLQTYKDPQHTWIKDRSGQLPGEIQVNFEDDYERIHKAIFGFITEDWAKTERQTIQSLEEIAAATAEEAVAEEILSQVEDPQPDPEPNIVEMEATATISTEVEPDPEPEETLKEESAPVDDVKPPANVDPETGEISEDGPWECADCGGVVDSIDQKELSEIMLKPRRIACNPCYRKANAK